jgi:hypothetical protein
MDCVVSWFVTIGVVLVIMDILSNKKSCNHEL